MAAIDQLSKSPAADRLISGGLINSGKVIKTSKIPHLPVNKIKPAYTAGRIGRASQRVNTTINQEQQNQVQDGSDKQLPSFQPSINAKESPLLSSAYDPFKKIKQQYKIY